MPEQPWLCCSPDGLAKVGDDSVIIEIKCPHRCRKSKIVNEGMERCFVDYLHFVNGELSVKQTHSYYTQLQIQLYVLNLTRAIFSVYSPQQLKMILVQRNDSFLAEVIPKLEFFLLHLSLAGAMAKTE